MPNLQYGLNIKKKPVKSPRSISKTQRKTIFDEESGSEESDHEGATEEIESLGGLQSYSQVPDTKQKPTLREPATRPSHESSRFNNLASSYTSKRHTEAAQEQDASIYDYDAVYDSLHVKPEKVTRSQGPTYLQGLLESAEIRKRDQLQAKDKMLAKEREAEGDEYAGKEKFVTGAYKAQQEEVRKLAEEEKRKEAEAEERRRKAGGGMTGWYKDVLQREEDRHAAISKALLDGTAAQKTKDDGEGEIESIGNATASKAMLNDEGAVVDKRDLLTAGLNIKSRHKTEDSEQMTGKSMPNKDSVPAGKPLAKAAMRERQTRMLEAQLEQNAKRAADEGQTEQEALQRAAKSRKTKEEVSSAKERYLQRKKEAEAKRNPGENS